MTDKTNTSSNPVVEIAKRERKPEDETIELSTGVKIRLTNVPSFLIDDARSMVRYPSIPKWYNPDKDREEDNPNDPNYLAECAEVDRMRGVAMLDAMIMFGVELVDGVPEVGAWGKRLKLLDRLGRISLSAYDIEDDVDREFLYKKYVAFSKPEDFAKLGGAADFSSEEVEAAEAGFPSDETRSTD